MHFRAFAGIGLPWCVLAFVLAVRPSAQAPPGASPTARDVATAEEVQARCGTACHKLPPPDILPRSAWRDELVRMMLIQEGVPEPAGSSHFIPLPPDWLRVLRYYEAKAPAALPDPEPWPAPATGKLAFTRRSLVPPGGTAAPAIANVRLVDLDGDRRLDVLASDMRLGAVLAGYGRKQFALETIAELRHPSHIEPVDLDRDGLLDLLVADLGSFQPADHHNGSVHWLRRSKDGRFTAITLAEGLSRLADARAADLDGDKDLDIVLGVFGWRRTGNITVLENRTQDWKNPVFTPTVVDKRTGAIHVPVADVNADGRPDIVALLAQEHESVVALVNDGKGLAFTPRTLYAAPHPNWGSSGIELVDLDKDGDLDVLMTHGDTFDDFVLKPYHGIQWLENTGNFELTPRTLAALPGAHRAAAADVDGDGDLDIVATAMVAGGGGPFEPKLASLVWLEQTAPRVFERRTIELGEPYHATLDVGDVDGDGDPDVAVGLFAFTRPLKSWVELWENRKK
jgi:hypothetical protein